MTAFLTESFDGPRFSDDDRDEFKEYLVVGSLVVNCIAVLGSPVSRSESFGSDGLELDFPIRHV